MEILKNLYSRDEFDNLEDAKKYYLPEEDFTEEDYIGNDFESDAAAWREYRDAIKGANHMEELATILNKYTDIFGDGS